MSGLGDGLLLCPAPPPARRRGSSLPFGDPAEEGQRDDDLFEARAAVETAALPGLPRADPSLQVQGLSWQRTVVEEDRAFGRGLGVAIAEALVGDMAGGIDEGCVAVVAGEDDDPVILDGLLHGVEEA